MGAKPGEAEAPSTTYATDAKPVKEKKKKKKKAAFSSDSMQIRDLSEALPKPRAEAAPVYSGHQAKLLALDLDEDEARLVRDNELDYVEEDAVVEASKIDVEKSGIAWKI